jgi:hypothetical protein
MYAVTTIHTAKPSVCCNVEHLPPCIALWSEAPRREKDALYHIRGRPLYPSIACESLLAGVQQLYGML